MRVGTQDIGTGTRTLVAIVTAESLGLQPSQVTPEIGDTVYGVAPGSGGSTTAGSISPAIRIAVDQGARRAEGEGRAGAGDRRRPRSSPPADACTSRTTRRKGMSWADACKQIGPQPIAADGDWQPGLSSVTTSGAQFAEVTVDIGTGIVEVEAGPGRSRTAGS